MLSVVAVVLECSGEVDGIRGKLYAILGVLSRECGSLQSFSTVHLSLTYLPLFRKMQRCYISCMRRRLLSLFQ